MTQGNGRAWLAPLTGVLAIIVVFVGFIVMGEPKSAEDPVEEVVEFYLDNEDSVRIGAFIEVLAGLLLMAFGAYLRAFFRRVLGPDVIAPTLIFAGTAIIAIWLAIDGTISFALAESADDIEPSAVQALQALWDNDFLLFILGVTAFLLGTGVSILRSGALPKWLGAVMILALIIGFTPIGWVAGIVAALGVIILSVMLALRERSETTAA